MPARRPFGGDGAVTTVPAVMIPHEPGTWMNRGPGVNGGTAESELTLLRKVCTGPGGQPSVRRRRGSIREFTGFTCEHCYEHQSWDSRRPSARRPSGITFHTYPLLSARRPAGAAAALSLCQTKEVLAD